MQVEFSNGILKLLHYIFISLYALVSEFVENIIHNLRKIFTYLTNLTGQKKKTLLFTSDNRSCQPVLFKF